MILFFAAFFFPLILCAVMGWEKAGSFVISASIIMFVILFGACIGMIAQAVFTGDAAIKMWASQLPDYWPLSLTLREHAPPDTPLAAFAILPYLAVTDFVFAYVNFTVTYGNVVWWTFLLVTWYIVYMLTIEFNIFNLEALDRHP
jgi:hypothetical protein